MKPVSVHGADPNRPFTVTHDGTIGSLRDALDHLCNLGYEGTAIMRADIEAGPCCTSTLELYDTTDEHERGEVDRHFTFILC
jgi:hypothetical protein